LVIRFFTAPGEVLLRRIQSGADRKADLTLMGEPPSA
jgi:hypothetical protein